jgi:phage-related protein
MTDQWLGFIFNGVPSLSFGVAIALSGIHVPLLPPVKDRIVDIPTRDGAWDYGASYGPMDINLDCFIVEPNHATLMSNAIALGTLLDVRAGARPLILPDRDGYFMARYTGKSDFVPLVSTVKFTIPFVCVDPFIHH